MAGAKQECVCTCMGGISQTPEGWFAQMKDFLHHDDKYDNSIFGDSCSTGTSFVSFVCNQASGFTKCGLCFGLTYQIALLLPSRVTDRRGRGEGGYIQLGDHAEYGGRC